ncbi:MAG TPA: hypothetical protein VJR92_12370 [Gemmatimonadaceae bacterium]|nr:hypothetical protein [Gemmatimonadaceae bacterium]
MTDAVITEKLYTAVVHAEDGVRFVAAAPNAANVTQQLLRYVAERCDHALWPDDARDVHLMIAAGRVDDAIAHYFAHVGARWDAERLDRH